MENGSRVPHVSSNYPAWVLSQYLSPLMLSISVIISVSAGVSQARVRQEVSISYAVSNGFVYCFLLPGVSRVTALIKVFIGKVLR